MAVATSILVPSVRPLPTRRLCGILLAAAVSIATARATFAAPFDEMMPADTAAYVVVEGLDRLGDAPALGDALSGAVRALAGGTFDPALLDAHRPIAIWWLASGERVAVPASTAARGAALAAALPATGR